MGTVVGKHSLAVKRRRMCVMIKRSRPYFLE